MAVSIPKAGELNKRITLIRRTDNPLNEWEAQQTDEVIATLWAKIEPTGAMYWGTVQVEQKATHRFWIRSIKGKSDDVSINHGVLIKYQDRFYQPTRVTDCNGLGTFTMVEAQELGVVEAENSNPLYTESVE